MDDVAETLDEQIGNDLAELADTKLGSDERDRMTKQLNELYRLRLEEKKIESDKETRNWARKLKLGLEAAGLVIPNAIYLATFLMGLNFEKTGVIKSSTVRKVLNHARPAKLTKLFKW